MEDYMKMLPIPDGDTEEFWKGCKRHELLIQRCKSCGIYRFYPRPICSNCSSMEWGWVKSGGKGQIYTFVVFHHAFHPSWQEELPYVVAVIELEEGVRLIARVVECSPQKVQIGMKVEVVFNDVSEEITLPQFRPI